MILIRKMKGNYKKQIKTGKSISKFKKLQLFEFLVNLFVTMSQIFFRIRSAASLMFQDIVE